MPLLSESIEGCAYSPQAVCMGFSYHGMSVFVERQRIVVSGAQDEAQAKLVLNKLRTILKAADPS